MAYVNPNFKHKRALVEALAQGLAISVYQPGLGQVPFNGPVYLEGPHFPQPHSWYAKGTMKEGKLISVT